MTEADRQRNAEFMAGFKPLALSPKRAIAEGNRVRIVGAHPHAGAEGTFVGFRSTVLGERPVVRFDESRDGVAECFVMDPRHWRPSDDE